MSIKPDQPGYRAGPGRNRPRVWLLSAYAAASHKAWADWLLNEFDTFDWLRLELPGRHFGWRIRGNPLSWLDALPARAPDLILATSMVDLATLRGIHPHLAAVPSCYYFHENQFAYPTSEQQFRSADPQMVQIYGALAGDILLFNSAFNRDSFLDGLDALLRRLPDATPERLPERLAARCRVLPVPIRPIAPAPERDARLLLWNHRWEYDKAPQDFADAACSLADQGLDFRLALLGARHADGDPALRQLRERLGPRIVADACLERPDYAKTLGRAGVAVSTARHEFQGLAMLEAVSAGARPLAPAALCYTEQYPSDYLYDPARPGALAERLADWLAGGLPPPVDVRRWYPETLRAAWRDTLLDALGAVATAE